MELRIVEFFQQFSTPFIDGWFQVVTQFGDELVFLLVASFLYWCVNKAFAYRLMVIFLLSALTNEGLKSFFKRPRPYHMPTVRSIGETTHGYGFPSGHAQNSTTLALFIQERYGKIKGVKPFLLVLVGLVALSRIYLGQHYLSDALTGILVAYLIYRLHLHLMPYLNKHTKIINIVGFIILFGLVIVIHDKNAYVAYATLLGVSMGYHLENKFVSYDVRAPWKIQLMKYAIGLVIALTVKEGLKLILPYPEEVNNLTYLLDFIRYLVLSLWMSFGSMYLFKKLFKVNL